MFRKVAAFAGFGLMLAAGAAQAQCVEPVPPPPVDGAAVTADQLRVVLANARDFIAQSNVYQACLQAALDDARSQTGGDRSIADPALQEGQAKIAANQRLKEKVSLDANTAMDAYKKSHAD